MFSIISIYSPFLLIARLMLTLTLVSCCTSAHNSSFPTTFQDLRDSIFIITQYVMRSFDGQVPLQHLIFTDEIIQTIRMIQNAVMSILGSENDASRYFVAFALALLLTSTLTCVFSVASKLAWKLISVWFWIGKGILILGLMAMILSLGD